MNTNQPKYITYKGTKYQRVDSINEIEVRNIPPKKLEWCVVKVLYDRKPWLWDREIYTSPDFLSIENVLNSVKISWYSQGIDDGDFSIRKLDDYTYCGGLDEDIYYIVCTRNKGVGKRVYEVVEKSSDIPSEVLSGVQQDELVNEVINTIIGVLGPNWDF